MNLVLPALLGGTVVGATAQFGIATQTKHKELPIAIGIAGGLTTLGTMLTMPRLHGMNALTGAALVAGIGMGAAIEMGPVIAFLKKD
jgi:hypothetical protein